jgi:hypothetical protein
MNLVTETAISTDFHPALLTDGLARTDQELLRQSQPKPVPMEAPWTKAPEKERGAMYGYRLIRIGGSIYVVSEVLSVDTAPNLEVSRIPQKAVWVTADTTDKHYVWLENSTAQQERPEAVDQEITNMFDAAKEQDLEDGMESEFSTSLLSLVRKYGNAAMEVVAGLIIYERVNAEVASEALRWLGHMADPTSYHFRRWLLERSLRCSSAMVRDGAALGLASMDDPHAIPYLKQAILREDYTELSEDMRQVLAQLEKAY